MNRLFVLMLILIPAMCNAQNGYRHKNGRVYFCDELVEMADWLSFKVLGHGYAKDNNNVYYKGDILRYVEPSTFNIKEAKNDTPSGNAYYKVIDNNVFYKGKEVDVFPIRGFKDLGDGYAKNTFDVYYEGKKIPDASASSFKNIGNGYAKDSFHTYYLGQRTEKLK